MATAEIDILAEHGFNLKMVAIMKTMLREVMRDCKMQMARILNSNGSPFSAAYMGAKFNYFFALAQLNGEVSKHFDKLKAMYDDYHRQARVEGFCPIKLERFE